MSDGKIIAVVGATGAQGGSLVKAILGDPSGGFRARALTRKPGSDKGRALAEAGAEVVAADLDDVASLEAAFSGAHGAFMVTNFWEHFSPEKELVQARNMAEAAKAAGLEHVIWSTLDDTRKLLPVDNDTMPTLGGKYNVPHFDAKGEADAIFREIGVPTTFLQTVFYWDNLIFFGSGPKRGEDGKLAFVLPMDDAKLPAIAVEDIGAVAYAIFKRGAEFIGKTVGISGEQLNGAEMAAALSDALGEPVTHAAVPPDVYRTFDFPGADDMGNMFQFKRDFNDYYTKSRDPKLARELHPGLQTFREWLSKNAGRIPID